MRPYQLAAIAALLVACGDPPGTVFVESPAPKIAPVQHTEERRYELMDVDPPKHMYVTLRDIETNKVHSRIKVAKRCSDWQKAAIGANYSLVITYWSNEPHNIRFENLKAAFC